MSKSQHKKISMGYVVQVYEDLECVRQYFVSLNEVKYTSMADLPLPFDAIVGLAEHEVYQPFDMVQPQHVEFKLGPKEKEAFQKHLLFYLTQYPEELIDQLCQVVMDYPKFVTHHNQQKRVEQDPATKRKLSYLDVKTLRWH